MVPEIEGLELLDRTPFLCEDRVGRLGPDKRSRVGIVVVKIIMDGIFKFANAAKDATPDALIRDFGEELLDEIEP